MMKKTIPIFFTIDDKYAPYAGVAIQSMIQNASPAYYYQIMIIYQDLTEKNREKLAHLATENVSIQFHYMKTDLETITDRVENRLRCDYFTLTIFFRLFIADIFSEYDKGIYVDSDIVVPGDISELYQIELGDNIMAASVDHSIQDIPELTYYVEEAVGIKRQEYINSGVLLMNLKEMREKKLSERFLTLLNQYHFETVAPDQDYLNAICHGKIVYLEECWDAMPIEGKKPLENPKLIHYNLFSKPWCYDHIGYEEYFWNYAKESEFYEEILDVKKKYSQEEKLSDRQCLEKLMQEAYHIPEKETTFQKIYEAGEEVRL